MVVISWNVFHGEEWFDSSVVQAPTFADNWWIIYVFDVFNGKNFTFKYNFLSSDGGIFNGDLWIVGFRGFFIGWEKHTEKKYFCWWNIDTWQMKVHIKLSENSNSEVCIHHQIKFIASPIDSVALVCPVWFAIPVKVPSRKSEADAIATEMKATTIFW